jgi:hypothetical protein
MNTCTTIEQRGVVRFFVGKTYGCSKGYQQRNAVHMGSISLWSMCDVGKISVGCTPRRDGNLEIINAAKLYFSDYFRVQLRQFKATRGKERTTLCI